MAAVQNLLAAVERNPELFSSEAGDFDTYFGDAEGEDARSDHLESQMRRYRRISELNPGSPEALALTVYCAWRLGDTVGAGQSMESLEQMVQDDPETPERLLIFVGAMKLALM